MNPTNWANKPIKAHVYQGEITKPQGVRYLIIPQKGLPYVILSDKSIEKLRTIDKYKNCEIKKA